MSVIELLKLKIKKLWLHIFCFLGGVFRPLSQEILIYWLCFSWLYKPICYIYTRHSVSFVKKKKLHCGHNENKTQHEKEQYVTEPRKRWPRNSSYAVVSQGFKMMTKVCTFISHKCSFKLCLRTFFRSVLYYTLGGGV